MWIFYTRVSYVRLSAKVECEVVCNGYEILWSSISDVFLAVSVNRITIRSTRPSQIIQVSESIRLLIVIIINFIKKPPKLVRTNHISSSYKYVLEISLLQNDIELKIIAKSDFVLFFVYLHNAHI